MYFVTLRSFAVGICLGLCFLLVGCSLIEPVEPSKPTAALSNEVQVTVQLYQNCDYETILGTEITATLESENFVFVHTKASFEQIQTWRELPCVVRTFQPSELESVLEDLQSDFDSARDKKFEELKLNRGIDKTDVTNRDELKKYLEEKREADLHN